MSEAGAIAAFAEHLRRQFAEFRAAEPLIRQQYERAVAAGSVPKGAADRELLERPTRRFMVDGILRGLGWDPDDPSHLAEEARSEGSDGARLYFDYLGLAARTRAPVMLVEAKAYDVKAARRPHGPDLDARDMQELIREALAALKKGDKSLPVIAEWGEWLKDLRTYVLSLGPQGQSTLKRVVITAGRWMTVFEDPVDAFVSVGAPRASRIHCFTSLEDIVERHARIFRLLQRQRLVDTLSLTMPAGEALGILKASEISHAVRGVVVATRASGAARREYPTRSVWPSLVVLSAGRPFAVTDYGAAAVEEPLKSEEFPQFLAKLSAQGAAFEARVLNLLGRPDLLPSHLGVFGGFTEGGAVREAEHSLDDPISEVAADLPSPLGPSRKFVVHTGEPGALPEYVAAAGELWFYKAADPNGSPCAFHSWGAAKQAGVAAPEAHMGASTTSFTESGQTRHCAHDDFRRMRAERCHIDVLETHLCCRACVFLGVCWAVDDARMPCPRDKA